MTDYEKRIMKEKMYRDMKRAVYLDLISKAFEKGDYEDLEPVVKINILGVIVSHSKLSNRIEG